jgi:plastocyanin
MRKLSVVVSLCALAPFALAACGGGGSSSSSSTAATSTSAGGGGGETVKVSADPSGQLAFQESSLSAKAGNDTFDFTNDAPVTHDFCIEDSSGTELGCSDTVQGGSSTLTADLKAGKYTYFCSVDEHRQAGMEGTLTVK